ncbi:MAG: hypothetical protein P4L71_14065 [Acetobacteraceae bacterium]|nr:hypothetical protein [Acetobacteraceae bacterium]
MSGGPHVCGACGAAVRPPFRAPPPEIAPDLDMRPGEPARSTLVDWVQTCPVCGAAAPDLQALSPAAKPVVESPAYRALTTSGLEETLPFRRWAMICRETGDAANEAEALLQAAWAADDAAAMTDGVTFRQQVVRLWGDPADEETALRQLDVLRRAGSFDAAAARAAALGRRSLSETAAAILRFQQARIATRDIGRHLISSALPPPAHAPHVSHGKRPAPTLWSQLFQR